MKKYLITSQEFYTNFPDTFQVKLYEQIKKHNPDYVLYRDKLNQNYNLLARVFVDVCSQFDDIKSFIHQDLQLANSLDATGVHLTSNQFDEIVKAKKLGLEVIISTHTYEEVLKAQNFKADAVTYSPIFFSPEKGEPKGIEDLNNILSKSDINIFALGGIVDKSEVKQVKSTSAYGFASIRYFY